MGVERLPDAALDTLHTDIVKDEKARADRTGTQSGIDGEQKGVAKAEKVLRVAESTRDKILAEAGATDEASFDLVIQSIRRRGELEGQVSEISRRIEAMIGTDAQATAIQVELETGELGSWQQGREEEEQKVADLQEARDEAVRQHRDKETAVAQIAASADVAKHAIEVEAYRRRLSEEIAQWQRVVLARTLIEATLTKFEQEHQPGVVTRAAELFGKITEGRYPEVVSSEDALDVISDTGERIDVGDLSTGTVQQLYLCLRFALAEEFAARGTRLPLLMDDVLVNFDPERAAQVAEVIVDLSSRHQILLFTCHPETKAAIDGVAPNTRFIELDRYAG